MNGRSARQQLCVLENYACRNDAIPYYLFYNFTVTSSDYWHCGRGYNESQLGCTLVPSWIVRGALAASRRVGARRFEYLHQPRQALPWRCLFDCPHWEGDLGKSWSSTGQAIRFVGLTHQYNWVNVDPVEGAWPAELAGDHAVDLVRVAQRYIGDREEHGGLDSGQPVYRPRRLIFVDKRV